MTKYKLINDPVHGFITISDPLIFQLIEHPYFQRLRRISQMGLSNYVYPGTQHTRFHHALGAMHLMQKALQLLQQKGVAISKEEEQGTLIAILLHDIGHGPYSHTLEYVMTEGINHEFFSELMMQKLNEEFDHQLDLAIQIFKNNYQRLFLHELVSSQLDMDRLDYLARDSFFSGVYEGKLSTERIISMLNVVDNKLVVEEKGLYSIEKFIISRRLMYWQVYLHKTGLAAEYMLIQAIRRAKFLAKQRQLNTSSLPLTYFLNNQFSKVDFYENKEPLRQYTLLDDTDILFSLKEWQTNDDSILSYLSSSIIHRKLFQIKLKKKPIKQEEIERKRKEIQERFNLKEDEIDYYVLSGEVHHTSYIKGEKGIKILTKQGKIKDLWKCSDQLKNDALVQKQTQYYLSTPKDFYQ